MHHIQCFLLGMDAKGDCLAGYIVLIEDNPDDEMLTVRALKKNNVNNELIVLRDGAEAMDFFFAGGRFKDRDRNHTPALILLDLKLPKITGLELLEKLRAEPSIQMVPIVILTTSNEAQDVRTGYRLGANSYIRKPVDFNEFSAAIRRIVDYWLSLNFPAPELES